MEVAGCFSGRHRPLNACLLRGGPEKVSVLPDGLRAAEKEQPSRFQGEVKQLEDPLLGVPLQVDEHVSAAHQVDLGERRGTEQVVGREGGQVAGDLAGLKNLSLLSAGTLKTTRRG